MAKVDDEINYCIRCGSALITEERFGKARPVCPMCGWIYFADPKVAVAVVIVQEEKILLVRRAVVPKRGFWTLPAGFIDAEEDPRLAAARECKEEMGVNVRINNLLDVIYGQAHERGSHILIVYRGELVSGELNAADDIDQIGFFGKENLPLLAFPSTKTILDKAFQL